MTARRITDVAMIALFVAGIAGFGAMSLARPADVHSLARENRKPAPAPQLTLSYQSIKKAPQQVEEFFNDRIAFRESLLRWHAAVRFELGASPTEKVLIGRDGWLFLNEPKAESFGPVAGRGSVSVVAESFRKARAGWQEANRGVVVPAPKAPVIRFFPNARRSRRRHAPPTCCASDSRRKRISNSSTCARR